MKILVNIYAVSPTKGSEYAIGWNAANVLAEKHEVFVLYGTSGNDMGNTSELESLNKSTFNTNIRFIKVTPSFISNTLNRLNKLGLWIFFSPAFYFYQLDVLKVAKKLHKEHNFDIIHQLNPTGFREPGFLWKLNAPFVWGAISGTYVLPLSLVNWKNINSLFSNTFRNIVKWTYIKFSLRIRKVTKRADFILTVTEKDASNILKYFGKSSYVLPETFVNNNDINILPKTYKELKLIWIGSLDNRKNFSLLLDTLKNLEFFNWNLTVIGDGPLKGRYINQIETTELKSRIKFLGQIPRSEVKKKLKNADLHISTSLSEGTPTVLWEAFESGVPTISLKHCGMATVMCDKCGFLVPVDVRNYTELVYEFKKMLNSIFENPDILNRKRENFKNCLEKYTYNSRIKIYDDIYSQAKLNFNNLNK